MTFHVVPLLRLVQQRLSLLIGTASIQLKAALFVMLGLLIAGTPSLSHAADLPVTFYEEEDDDVWEVEAFANIFFMLNGLSSGAGGNGIIAQDNPADFIGNPTGPTQFLSMSDASSSGGTLVELGANIYRNHLGIGGSVMFGVGSGGGGSATMGYTPLSHNGSPGIIGTTGTNPQLSIDPDNVSLLFNTPLTTGPVPAQFGVRPVYGGARVSSQGASFRSYEANLIYRQYPGCDEDTPECACPDKANPICESRWKVHIGPRYFEFGEAYDIELEGYIPNNLGGAEAGTYSYFGLELAGLNKIYGLQIGGEYKLLKNHWDRVDLSLAGRVGYGVNNVVGGASGLGVQFSSGTAADPVSSYGGGGKDKIGTLFGQLDVSLSVDLTKNIELSGGYRGLWIEKTVSAAGVFSSIDVTQGGSVSEGNVQTEDMLLHMGRIGLNVSF